MDSQKSDQGASKNDREVQRVITTIGEIQITGEEYSKLTFRQKFAVTEYGYLLSPEDAEQVGRLLGDFVNEKDILAFCQSAVSEKEKGGKDIEQIDDSKGELVKNWLLIGLFIGLIPGLGYFLLTREGPGLTVINTICVGPAGVIGGIIGASIGKRSNNIAIATLLISILGAFLGLVFAGLTCFSCQ